MTQDGSAMTHAELVQRAARWLRYSVGCGVVFSEHTAGFEFPDAMGWKRSWSFVVECKVSRADFFADRKKPTRAGYDVRPGASCYYMTPPQLIAPVELPDGWGLVEVADARHANVRVIVKPKPDDGVDDRTTDQLRREVGRLYQEVRRYQAQGITYKKLADVLKAPTTLPLPDPPGSASPEEP